jgi:hypothetical protein
MNAHSQNALYASYAQGNAGMYNQTNGNFQKDQARAFLACWRKPGELSMSILFMNRGSFPA